MPDGVAPPRKLRMYRVVVGDAPPERLADFDPVVELTWVDRYGIECQTILVGTIARAISGVLDGAGVAEGAVCHGLLVAFAQSALFGARAARAGDYDFDAVLPGVAESRVRLLPYTWGKVLERLRHWVTGLTGRSGTPGPRR